MSEQLFTIKVGLYNGNDLHYYNLSSEFVSNAIKVIWQQGVKRPHNNLLSELISPKKIKAVWVEQQNEKFPIGFEELEPRENKPLSAKEQYDLLCEINPLVQELKEKLSLQLGY